MKDKVGMGGGGKGAREGRRLHASFSVCLFLCPLCEWLSVGKCYVRCVMVYKYVQHEYLQVNGSLTAADGEKTFRFIP